MPVQAELLIKTGADVNQTDKDGKMCKKLNSTSWSLCRNNRQILVCHNHMLNSLLKSSVLHVYIQEDVTVHSLISVVFMGIEYTHCLELFVKTNLLSHFVSDIVAYPCSCYIVCTIVVEIVLLSKFSFSEFKPSFLLVFRNRLETKYENFKY